MDMQTRQEKTERFFEGCLRIYLNKGADYNPSGVAFRDVRENAEAMGLSPLQVVGVFMSKHYAAVQSFIKDPGRPTSERVEGRLQDLANYCAMIAVMVQDDVSKDCDKLCASEEAGLRGKIPEATAAEMCEAHDRVAQVIGHRVKVYDMGLGPKPLVGEVVGVTMNFKALTVEFVEPEGFVGIYRVEQCRTIDGKVIA